MSEITEERLEPPLDCSHGRGPRWRCDDCAHEDWRSRALKAEATIREQRAEVVEWEARYGAACRDIGKLSFMRDSDKALHEAAEAEVNRLKAEVERLNGKLARAELSLAGARRKKVRYD